MDYTTIKIPVEMHRLIKNLAITANIAQQEVLQECLKDYEKKIFWEKFNLKYKEITDEKITHLSDDNDEILYENTLLDGLYDEY
jgi:hypothetical protein